MLPTVYVLRQDRLIQPAFYDAPIAYFPTVYLLSRHHPRLDWSIL